MDTPTRTLFVPLSAGERAAAASIGRKREAHRVAAGRAQEFRDGGGTADERNEVGAIAEYALAKHLGVLVDWVNTKAYTDGDPRSIPCDVGKDLHVRATSNPKARLLIVHESRQQTPEHPADRRHRRPTDPLHGVFVLARVEDAGVRFLGWRDAQDVRALGHWNTHSPGFAYTDRHAYTLEESELLSMDTIPPEAIK